MNIAVEFTGLQADDSNAYQRQDKKKIPGFLDSRLMRNLIS